MAIDNPHFLEEPVAIKLLGQWQEIQEKARLGNELEVAKLNTCGLAYLTHFLDLDTAIVNRFLKQDPAAQLIVSATQSKIGEYEPVEAVNAFWTEIDRTYPKLHTTEDRQLLETRGRSFAITLFLLSIDRVGSEKSDVIREINTQRRRNKKS
jgi:hypothetical protein